MTPEQVDQCLRVLELAKMLPQGTYVVPNAVDPGIADIAVPVRGDASGSPRRVWLCLSLDVAFRERPGVWWGALLDMAEEYARDNKEVAG